MEVEAKFTVPDEKTLLKLKQQTRFEQYRIVPLTTKQIRDSYLDTPERKILAGGYALRRRDGGGKTTLTLKGLGGTEGAIHRREELEVAIPPDNPRPAWVNSPVYSKMLQLTGVNTLAVLFSLYQNREVSYLKKNDRIVAELSLDRVCLTHGGRDHAYFELEIEQKEDGTEADLAALAAWLQRKWRLKPQPLSKFERGLAILSASPPALALTGQEHFILSRIAETEAPLYSRRAQALLALNDNTSPAEACRLTGLSARQVRRWQNRFKTRREAIFPATVLARAAAPPAANRLKLQPDETMMGAARKILQEQWRKLLYYEPGTRLGQDIEALHDMRVATRRIRAALRLFADYFEPETLRPFIKKARQTGRILGQVRDMDVFREKTARFLADQPDTDPLDLAPLHRAWAAQREAYRQEMLAYFNSAGYKQFKRDFAAFLKDPKAGALAIKVPPGNAQPTRLRHVLPFLLHRHWAAIRAYDLLVTAPEVSPAVLHRLRIACKRFRYALEFFQSALGPNAAPMIETLKIAQDHLGDLQDTVVAEHHLQNFLTGGTWTPPAKKAAPPATPDVERYLSARQAEQRALLADFPLLWQNLSEAGFNRRIAAIIKRL